MPLRVLICLILATLSTAPSAWGVELAPFSVRNLSPPALVRSLPAAESARLNRPGQFSARFAFDLSNIAADNDWGEQGVLLDGETYTATLGLRYGVAEHLQIGLDLPWVWQNGGFLDNFIENFHDTFGLPEGDRSIMPNDRISYAFTGGDGEDFLLDHDTGGIGDIRLLASWQWLDTGRAAANLQATVKAPTGDSDEFTGSGGWDISLSVSAQRDFTLEKGSASIWGGLGCSRLEDGDILPDRIRDWVVSGWVGVGWSPREWLGLKLQLDSHTALYDSRLRELGKAAVMLTMGGTFALGDATTLDIGLGEDLEVYTSPDVVIHLSLNHKF